MECAMNADIVLDCRNELGECILFDRKRSSVWWVNIHQGEIWRLEDGKGEAEIDKFLSRVGAIAFRRSGGLVGGAEKALAFFDLATGACEMIADVERDMPTADIVAYDYDVETGAISNGWVVVEASTAPGLPDGSVVEAEGCIWKARWGAGKVIKFTPEGKIDRRFGFPATNISCVGFGGSDLKSLFVTSAETHAGSLFVMDAGTTGLPEAQYHG
jgi:sugar lactone lactonase YvrE